MRFLALGDVLEIHGHIIQQTGGAAGVRDLRALEAAVAQPRMTFAGQDLYPDIIDKAAALMFSLIQNHPFLDGNKRTGHAAGEVFLLLNGYEIEAPVDEQERAMLQLASGNLRREELAVWLRTHTGPKD